MRSAEDHLREATESFHVPGYEYRPDRTEIEFAAVKLAIEQAQREAIEEAAKVADAPLMHRKGAQGLWRQRRAAIAAAIRALGDQL